MRTFSLHPLIAVLLGALIVMTVGGIVLLQLAFIAWLWNVCIAAHSNLPPIGLLQGGLLYAAGLSVLYITGLLRIEFKAEKFD